MNSKTVLSAIIGTIAGLALAMGTVAFAQNAGHMGTTQGISMMGQTTQQGATSMGTHNNMQGKTMHQGTHGNMQNQHPATSHHTGYSQTTGDTPCPAGATVKGESKT